MGGAVGIRCPSQGRRHLRPPNDLLVLTRGVPATVNLLKDRRNVNAGGRRRTTQREKDRSIRTTNKSGVGASHGTRTTTWLYVSGGSTSADKGILHRFPALMFEALARDLVLFYSRPGDLVLHPFAGAC